MRRRDTEPLGDERVQFRLRQGPGAAFVAAGFQHARTGRKLQPGFSRRQFLQQMHERERRSQNQQRSGIVQCKSCQRSIEIHGPRSIGGHAANKGTHLRALFAPNEIEHVNKRGVRRLRGWWREDDYSKCSSRRKEALISFHLA